MDQDENKRNPAPEQPSASLSPEKAAQKRRLAEALRANLRRRKTQARGRKAEDDAL
jgi:hypothetical protein